MKKVATFLTQFKNDKTAATAIEYGLIAALIAVVIVVGVQTVGNDLLNSFNTIANNI